ncbi:MAG: prepilin-type N-terminal cleavage/methylation domain-containing protein [Planctomycetes bacterium]|nr:prepilin-type N-terminal cleavage/methylation domain-containing protein [Planctomycetota bacterium]
MSRIRSGRPGFSLTEILMAVGILGVGLTMVASVFPVAVDQHRRGRDSTMAALCARSVAATMRATRQKCVGETRDFFNKVAKDNNLTYKDKAAEYDGPPLTATDTANRFPLSTTVILTKELRVYNPQSFLYESGRQYDTVSKPSTPSTAAAFWSFWNAGNYVPVIYVTPLANNLCTGTAPVRTSAENPRGPWRVTIVVFRSRGAEPTRTKHWALDTQSKAVAGGDYIIERTRNAGEAYLIDYVKNPATTPTIFLGVPKSATGTTNPPTSAPTLTTAAGPIWYVLPGAVAAFHTIIGD